MAEAYKPYIDYLTSGGVAETAYLVAHNGAILATNLPIQQFPAYEFEIEDENDPSKTHKIVVEEGKNLIEAINNNGVCKHPAGIRLYNQKYYTVNFDAKDGHLYLKKNEGGACIAITKNYYIIATFNIKNKMENGVPQNPGELNKRVEELAKNLKGQGY